MNLKKTSPTAPLSRLVDDIMDSYVAWRQESIAVNAAYANWTCAVADERGLMFHAYLAALDREEYAATAYQRILEEVGSALP